MKQITFIYSRNIIFFLTIVNFSSVGQSIELKPGNNGFVLVPNVSALGTCNVAGKGKIVYLSTDNNLYVCSGTSWKNVSSSGSFSLPYSASSANMESLLTINNTYASYSPVGAAIKGTTSSTQGGTGLYGVAQNPNPNGSTMGIKGENNANTDKGIGVYGNHLGTGVGVWGSSNGIGVKGVSSGNGSGVQGIGTNGAGGYFTSTNGSALITENGAVGIGTIEPKYPLTFKTALGDKISFWGGNNSATTHNHYGIGMQGAALQFFVPTTADNLVFGIGRSSAFTERVRITGGGNVGIGISNPQGSLEVKRGMGLNGTAAFYGTVHTSHFNYAAGEETYIRGGKNGSHVFINDLPALGYVGIKNSNPAYSLDVTGRIRLRNESTDLTAGMWLDGPTLPVRSFIGAIDNNRVGIYGTASGWSFALNVLSGNVGINTLSANSKLQVAGSLSLPIKVVTDDYTITDNDYSIHIDASQYVDATITLPSAIGRTGRIYVISATINLTNTGGGGLTFISKVWIENGDGSNIITNSPYAESNYAYDCLLHTVDNTSPKKKKTSITLQSNGSKWIIIANDFQH